MLEQRDIEIPLTGRLDSNQSVDLQSPDTLRTIRNFRYGKMGELIKRSTYTNELDVEAPTDAPYAGTQIDACFSRGDEPVVLTRDFGIARALGTTPTELTYPDVLGSVGTDLLKYAPRACRVSRQIVESVHDSRDASGIYIAASAVYSGVLVLAYLLVENNGNLVTASKRLRVKAIDLATGATLTEGTQVSLGANFSIIKACPYTEAGSEGVLVTYSTGAAPPFTISCIRYDFATGAFSASANLTTNANGAAHAVAQKGTGVLFAFTDDTSGFLTVEDRTVSTVSTTHTATHSGAGGVSLIVGASRSLVTSYSGTNMYNEVFGTPADVVTTALGATPITLASAAETRSGDAHSAIVTVGFRSVSPTDNYHVLASRVDFTSTTPTYTAGRVFASAFTAGGSFTVDGRAYAIWSLPGNPSVMVVRLSVASSNTVQAHPVARVCHDRYSSFFSLFSGVAAPIASVVDGSVYVSITADAGTAAAAQTIFLSRIDFAVEAMPLPYVELDGVVTVASGLMFDYDGRGAAESAILAAPYAMVVDTTAAATTWAAGTYSFAAVFSCVDRAGRLKRSAPMLYTGATVGATEQVDVYVNIPPLSAYDGVGDYMLDVSLYVTEDGGATYYLASTANGVYSHDTVSGNFVVFTDVEPASTSAPQLYSTGADGAELLPEVPPAMRSVERIGDRLWGVDAEDRTRWWCTKPIVAGYVPEWNTGNTGFIGDEGVAVCDLNGLPAILGERGVWVVEGAGPNENGVGFFSPARRLPYELGCVSTTSVCKTPGGVVFRSHRGWHLLDAGLALQSISGPVDTLLRSTTDYSKLRALYDARHDELRIFGEAEGAFVFNLRESKWTVFDTEMQNPVDACIAGGRLWYVHDDDGTFTLRRELGIDEDAHNVSAESTVIATPLYSFDGVTGMKRLWRILLALRLSDDVTNVSSLTVRMYTDGDLTTVAKTWTWTGAQLADQIQGTSRVVRLTLCPTNQFVRSFSLEVTETCSSAYGGSTPIAHRPVFGVVPGSKRPKAGALKG